MQDIKQMLPTQFLRIRELLMVRFRAVLYTENVTDAQWRALRVIHECHSVDFSTLADLSLIAKPSLSRVISSLEGRGLVCRAGVEADQRQVQLSLTSEGVEFVDTLAPRIDEVYYGLLSDLGEERMDRLAEVVAECIDVLSPVNGKLANKR